jgi:hypothetical protein
VDGAMDTEIVPGTKRLSDGVWRVFYDGYWIKAYEVPADTLLAKKRLIEASTRRLFNHVEHGLNVPSTRLEEARQAFESESDVQLRRVKGAMLAGALFNRAADIFTKLVDIQACGVKILSDNALMRQCGEHLQEALLLGRMVLHRSGEEGIDELWGEPFKAFAFPIEEFYKSRYIKISQAMRAIDYITDELTRTLTRSTLFLGVESLVRDFAEAAKVKCETLRTSADIFEVWAAFVVTGERLCAFAPGRPSEPVAAEEGLVSQCLSLIRQSKDLVGHIARARVPMPKSTRELIERFERFRTIWTPAPSNGFSDRPQMPAAEAQAHL